MVYAYLWGSADKLNWERSFAFFERLAKVTKPRAVRGYTPSQRLLAAGDFGLLHFGLFSRAFRDARDGAPVGVGAVEPMTASLVNIVIMKNAPHPNAARLAAGWLTTTEGQEQLSKSWGNLALDPHAQSAPAEYGKKWGVTIDKISLTVFRLSVNLAAPVIQAVKLSNGFVRSFPNMQPPNWALGSSVFFVSGVATSGNANAMLLRSIWTMRISIPKPGAGFQFFPAGMSGSWRSCEKRAKSSSSPAQPRKIQPRL